MAIVQLRTATHSIPGCVRMSHFNKLNRSFIMWTFRQFARKLFFENHIMAKQAINNHFALQAIASIDAKCDDAHTERCPCCIKCHNNYSQSDRHATCSCCSTAIISRAPLTKHEPKMIDCPSKCGLKRAHDAEWQNVTCNMKIAYDYLKLAKCYWQIILIHLDLHKSGQIL